MSAGPIAVSRHWLSFRHPAPAEPRWSGRVDRWYQLDAAAYGIAESHHRLGQDLGPWPSLLILASPWASNETDVAFARAGASSPARFVHSLPSVRSSAFCQLSGWSGPMLCLQRDPHTLGTALAQAALHLAADPGRPVWIATVIRAPGPAGLYEALWISVGGNPKAPVFELHREVAPPAGDSYLIQVLKIQPATDRAAGLPGGYVLRCGPGGKGSGGERR